MINYQARGMFGRGTRERGGRGDKRCGGMLDYFISVSTALNSVLADAIQSHFLKSEDIIYDDSNGPLWFCWDG